ncbi:NAD(P)H-binding protein [Streptomyces sp. NPDC050658]|uniref:NAD(P)H-binding protein n=1 Tax=unclassified Streptomyces TaxID=2593676 RepID=UPI0034486BB0
MTETRPLSSPVLVLGATGKTGGLVAAGLRDRGVAVRRAARSLADGPDSAHFDWRQPATWERPLTDASALYLVTPMDPDFSPLLVDELITRATAAGVRRVVLLSGLSAGYGSAPMLDRERPVRASTLEWTVLRPGAFIQNFAAEPYLTAVSDGVLRMPLGPGPGAYSAYIDVRDIADVAVTALTRDGHAGHVYDLAGPRALSFAEALATIGDAVGRQVRYEHIPLESWLAEQRAAGVPAPALAWSVETFDALGRGAYAPLHDGVRHVLGREPRDFAAYVREAAAASTWTWAPAPPGRCAG